MCRKALFEKNFLTYASWISIWIKASSFLRILNVYSHTKLNTPVLFWSLQLSNFGLTHVTKHFSVTNDCVRFLIIGRFPLYTYYMELCSALCTLTLILGTGISLVGGAGSAAGCASAALAWVSLTEFSTFWSVEALFVVLFGSLLLTLSPNLSLHCIVYWKK